ncbi:TetR/AcrR family transcriptional regulator [Kribbella sp. NBC_01245]|uniref:TetR/AcrR family transcriptional regulator n=1 Tax=Kribbella sp. NBC_01245 TaxID=2903578 RepID=UPI002E29A3E9|nr:TetR/AcrR family transcriptional regulator [Kribbella sp. NBC_01245]
METNNGERPRRGRPRDPEAEPRIRRHAIQLLLERGFDGMTVDDVAEAAGVGKATIYRRWASKEELAHDAMTEVFSIEVPDPDTGSIAGDLTQVYADAVVFASSKEGLALIRLAISEINRDELTAALYRRFLQHRIDLTAAAVDRARSRGEAIRPDADISVMVQWLAGVLIMRALTGEPMPGVEDVDALVRMTLFGICGDAATTVRDRTTAER